MSYASTNRIHERAAQWSDSASQAIQAGAESARETIAENPASAVFSSFAAGFGLGIGLALMFATRNPPPMDYGLSQKFSEFLNEHVPWMRR